MVLPCERCLGCVVVAVSLPPANAERSRVHRQVGNLIDGMTSVERVKSLQALVQLTWAGADIAHLLSHPFSFYFRSLMASTSEERAVPYARDVYRLEGGIPILLPFLSSSKPDVQEWAAILFHNVMYRSTLRSVRSRAAAVYNRRLPPATARCADGLNQEVLRILWGLPDVLAAFFKAQSERVQLILGNALCMVVIRDSANQQAVREAKGIVGLVSLLQRSSSVKVKQAAVTMLGRLCYGLGGSDRRNADAVIRAGGLEALLAQLRIDDADLTDTVLSAVRLVVGDTRMCCCRRCRCRCGVDYDGVSEARLTMVMAAAAAAAACRGRDASGIADGGGTVDGGRIGAAGTGAGLWHGEVLRRQGCAWNRRPTNNDCFR
jgi:hypothetical protein